MLSELVVLSLLNTQFMCLPRTDLVSRLQEKYEERLTAIAKVNDSTLVEIWTSKDGTWTLIYTMTNGTACLIMSGTDWQSLKPRFGAGS